MALECFYTNADCLISKLEELKERVASHPVDIVAIVETALQDDERSPRYCPNECLEIPGYQLHRKNNNKEIKGGILIYVKD